MASSTPNLFSTDGMRKVSQIAIFTGVLTVKVMIAIDPTTTHTLHAIQKQMAKTVFL